HLAVPESSKDAPESVLLAVHSSRVCHTVKLSVITARSLFLHLMENIPWLGALIRAARNCRYLEEAVRYRSCIRRVQLRVGHGNRPCGFARLCRRCTASVRLWSSGGAGIPNTRPWAAPHPTK